MNWVGTGVVLAVLSVACTDQAHVTEPPLTPSLPPVPPPATPVPPPAPLPPGTAVYRSIGVGEQITGRFKSDEAWVIDLTVGTAGIAVVRLSCWPELTWVDLFWENQHFEGPRGRGIVGITVRKPVDPSRPSRLTILDAYPWDNYGSSFVLETSLE